jgi:hypothetical protein
VQRALGAAMPEICPVRGVHSSRGFCQYLAFFPQHTVLTAQLIKLLAFASGQAIAAQTVIQRRLFDPLANRLGRGPDSRASSLTLRPALANSMMRRRYSARMVDGGFAARATVSVLRVMMEAGNHFLHIPW